METLEFEPLLKPTIWGGSNIIPLKGLAERVEHVGESWEISGLPGHESRVSRGACKGRDLTELVRVYKDRLVGRKVYQTYGDNFPLLIKLIDAADDLSIQVHPNDRLAQSLGHKRGKTEMWHVINAEPGASILIGLREQITPEEFRHRVADHTIANALNRIEVNPGDTFFIPAGCIHAIGRGCLLAEIQQSSDLTFRIWDYNRHDASGNLRQLHTELAAKAIDYTPTDGRPIDYSTTNRHANNHPAMNGHRLPDLATKSILANGLATLVSCPYFITRLRRISKQTTLDYTAIDSFVVLIGLEGEGSLTDSDGIEHSLKAGVTLLVPASTPSVRLTGDIKLLETFIGC